MVSIAVCLPLARLGLKALELPLMSSHLKLEAYCDSVPNRADRSCPMSALVGKVCLKEGTLHSLFAGHCSGQGVPLFLLLH
jgi:hypothetical protein